MKSKAALVLATAFVVLFVGGGARFAIGLTFKPMVEDLGWTRGQLGLAVGLYMVVSALATFAGGRLADRASPRLLLMLGTLVGGAGLGLMAFVAAPWHAMLFYGIVFAVGNGAASMAPVSVMVTRVMPGRAGLANAAAMSGLSVGQLVMMAALTLVLVATGWRAVFGWLAFAHLAMVALLWALLPREPRGEHAAAASAGMDLGAALRTRRFWVLAGLYAICGMDDFFVTTHVVAFAQDKGIGAVLAGNLLALMGLAALVGVLLGGVFSDRFGPAATTAITFVLRIAVFGFILLVVFGVVALVRTLVRARRHPAS